MTLAIADSVPPDSPGALEIGFAIPQTYNASRILFDNLAKGYGERSALIGPSGTRSYAELCAEASRWGHGFQSLGLKRGDRILMFLDDTPAYPAAFFGAVRAGFVPLLINTLTPPDLLQFYLSDSSAAIAVADAEFCSRRGCRLSRLILPRPTPTATRWRSGCIRRARPAVPKASSICSTTWPTAKPHSPAMC
jgi:acetyl-CoA synthetase